jgi:REP element-mobilizing transposase RayT
MPNHVHVLFGPRGDTDVRTQCRSWKHYTAVRINRLLGRKGEFWQVESFDHAIRNPTSFDGFHKYIAANPETAGLKAGEYLLYTAGGEL